MPPKRIRPHVNPFSVRTEHQFEGFKNNNPIIIDIGACKGEFVFELSQKFPNKNFIAFEIRTPVAEKLEIKFKGYENIVVFDGDAARNLKNILKTSLEKSIKIETIYVNFPDPWFKDRHKKRRFINEKFLKEVALWLPREIPFVFQTDQKFLFEETLEVVEASPYNNVTLFSEPPFGIPTDWESAKVKEGSDIYRMEFSQ